MMFIDASAHSVIIPASINVFIGDYQVYYYRALGFSQETVFKKQSYSDPCPLVLEHRLGHAIVITSPISSLLCQERYSTVETSPCSSTAKSQNFSLF